MSLKTCSECGASVSSKADKCPKCGNPIKKKSSCLGIGCLIIVLIIAISALLSTLNETSSKTFDNSTNANTNIHKNDKDDLAYQLAVINKGGYVAKSDVSVTRFRYLLNTLDGKTIETKQQISDMTVTCQELLRDKYGVKKGLLDIMETLNETIPSGSKVQYAEIAAFYIQAYK